MPQPRRHTPARAIACLLAVGIGTCGLLACDPDEKAVPFKRGEDGHAATDASTPTEPAAAAPLPPVNRYDDRPARVAIDGHTLTIPEHHVLASLQTELSGDGLADALLLVEGPQGGLTLRSYVGRAGGALEAQAPVALIDEPGCKLAGAEMRALSTAHLLVEARLDCQAPSDAAPTPDAPRQNPVDAPPPVPEDQGRTVARAQTLVASLERSPRVLKRLELLPAPAQHAAATLELVLEGKDADGDGHPDVLASVALAGATAEPLRTQLTWLDRPGGLGRDAAQPEQALADLAATAAERARKQPADAIAIARQVRTLHGLLCHGGEAPMLRIDGVDGLPCGRSEARGRASAALVAALARESKLLEALAARAELHDSPAQRVPDRDRERADAALDAFPATGAYVLRRGPALDAPLAPAVHAPRLRFVDDGHLTVTGVPARSFDLATGQLTPIAGTTDALLTSPDRTLAITEVVRKCDGYHLRILRAGQIIAGVAAGRPTAEPLVTADPAPGGAACKDPLPQQAGGDDAHHVIHWGPDGVVVVRRGEVLLLPLDDSGHATGTPRPLSGPGASAADVAELRTRNLPGALSQTLPLPIRLGIALLNLQRGTAELIRIEGGGAAVTDLSLSPGGRHLAFLRGGFLWLAGPETPIASPSEAHLAPPATQTRDAGPPSP